MAEQLVQISEDDALAKRPLEQICKHAQRAGPDAAVRAGYVLCTNEEFLKKRKEPYCVATALFSTGHARQDATISKGRMYSCSYRAEPSDRP